MKVKLAIMGLLVAVSMAGLTSKASAAPTAEQACRAKEPFTGMIKVYAEWDYLNTQYAQAACWMKKYVIASPPYTIHCVYWVKYYVNTGIITGPWTQSCDEIFD